VILDELAESLLELTECGDTLAKSGLPFHLELGESLTLKLAGASLGRLLGGTSMTLAVDRKVKKPVR
jgi:hypothetical protein